MCDSGRKNPTLHKRSEAGYPSWPPQAHSTSSVESNNPEQSYVEASPDSGIEPSSSDDGHHATQLCKNEVEKPTDPSKKKTPMCLINELARYHKLQPTYRLVQESGPAHQKTFVVNVKLGDEEYSATGQSIKKAQHAAAQLVLQHTSYTLPEPKPKVKHPSGSQTDKIITPTVELNALAMKLNLPPVYSNLAAIPTYNAESRFDFNPNSSSPTVNRNDFRMMNQGPEGGRYLNADLKMPFGPTNSPRPQNANQKVFYNRLPSAVAVTHRVNLTVGKVSVIGEGPTPQAARHAAARLALEELRKEGVMKDEASKEADVVSEADTNSDLKSPVSVAHELALKLNQTVEFTVLSETGPPHMRNFVVQCKIGEIVTQGEGNCKKLAKKKAAEVMLIEIKKAHPNNGASSEVRQNNPISHRQRSKAKATVTRKKPRNLVKEVSSTPNRASLQDPISQLVQLQQSRKEKEPVFTVVSERGIPRSPEFVVKVTVGTFEATGIGAKKKDAKRAAALKALEAFGIVNEAVQITAQPNDEEGNVAPSEMPPDLNFINGREMLPGLLLLGKRSVTNRSNPTNNDSSTTSKAPKKFQSEMRLSYLAQILEYEIEFSDFPKGKTGEFVSLVTLNSSPPQVSHGLGSTLEEARDHAASNMLKLIAEGNLDSGGQNKENAEGAD